MREDFTARGFDVSKVIIGSQKEGEQVVYGKLFPWIYYEPVRVNRQLDIHLAVEADNSFTIETVLNGEDVLDTFVMNNPDPINSPRFYAKDLNLIIPGSNSIEIQKIGFRFTEGKAVFAQFIGDGNVIIRDNPYPIYLDNSSK